jgi:hypothetical protein
MTDAPRHGQRTAIHGPNSGNNSGSSTNVYTTFNGPAVFLTPGSMVRPIGSLEALLGKPTQAIAGGSNPGLNVCQFHRFVSDSD